MKPRRWLDIFAAAALLLAGAGNALAQESPKAGAAISDTDAGTTYDPAGGSSLAAPARPLAAPTASGSVPLVSVPPGPADSLWLTAAWVAGGLTVGFVAHESGHVVTNLLMGNTPTLEAFRAAGFIPFVAVRPNIDCSGSVCRTRDGEVFTPGRRGKFVIVTAGFDVQHVSSEIMLTLTPDLRHHRAPFQKGWLAFNTFTSLMYAVSAWVGVEDPRGDLRNAADLSGISSRLIAATVAVPAALDLWRYFHPEACWAAWAARASKTSLVGLTFAF